MGEQRSVLAVSGGVGGAKLSLGLYDILDGEQLHIVINTGDDFEHLGFHICPDIDTHLYTLSDRANTELGWGIAGETWHTMEALEGLGGETWFRLGDRDMATHIWRTGELCRGQSLGEVTAALAGKFGLTCHLHPMSEDPVHTTVHTADGDLPFQHYFVRHQCEPSVTGFSFDGISAARPNRQVIELLEKEGVSAVVICPSNPYVSIDPVLQVPGFWLALRNTAAPVIVVSPIVAGAALKGPAAKMMEELGVPVTAAGVARHYRERFPGLVDYFVIDESDATLASEIEQMGLQVAVTNTVMNTRDDKRALAEFVLQLAQSER